MPCSHDQFLEGKAVFGGRHSLVTFRHKRNKKAVATSSLGANFSVNVYATKLEHIENKPRTHPEKCR
jgi:hypothetical protein